MEAALRPASEPCSGSAASTSASVQSASPMAHDSQHPSSSLVPKKKCRTHQEKSQSLVPKVKEDQDIASSVSGPSSSLAPHHQVLATPVLLQAPLTPAQEPPPQGRQRTSQFAVLSTPEAFAAAGDLLILPVLVSLEVQDLALPVPPSSRKLSPGSCPAPRLPSRGKPLLTDLKSPPW